jgi:hypothetical protein
MTTVCAIAVAAAVCQNPELIAENMTWQLAATCIRDFDNQPNEASFVG